MLVGLGGLLCTVILLVPSTTATGRAGVGTTRAPYSGVQVVPSWSSGVGGCDRTVVYQHPHWSQQSGIGGMDLQSRVQYCPNQSRLSPTDSYVNAELTLVFPVHFLGVHHNVFVNGSISLVGSTSLGRAGSCPRATVPKRGYDSEDCLLYASMGSGISAVLVNRSGSDVSNYAEVGLYGNSSLVRYDSICYSTGRCFHSNSSSGVPATRFAGVVSFQLNLTPNAHSALGSGGRFFLEVFVSGSVYSQINGFPTPAYVGAVASSRLDFGTPGHGIDIASIVIT